jgi:hypothetical protein
MRISAFVISVLKIIDMYYAGKKNQTTVVGVEGNIKLSGNCLAELGRVSLLSWVISLCTGNQCKILIVYIFTVHIQ